MLSVGGTRPLPRVSFPLLLSERGASSWDMMSHVGFAELGYRVLANVTEFNGKMGGG